MRVRDEERRVRAPAPAGRCRTNACAELGELRPDDYPGTRINAERRTKNPRETSRKSTEVSRGSMRPRSDGGIGGLGGSNRGWPTTMSNKRGDQKKRLKIGRRRRQNGVFHAFRIVARQRLTSRCSFGLDHDGCQYVAAAGVGETDRKDATFQRSLNAVSGRAMEQLGEHDHPMHPTEFMRPFPHSG